MENMICHIQMLMTCRFALPVYKTLSINKFVSSAKTVITDNFAGLPILLASVTPLVG